MSQQVNVSRGLKFQGDAANKSNVAGNPSFEKMVLCDDFTAVAIDTTNDYVSTLDGTSDAVAITGAGAHTVTLTTGTGDNEVSFLGTQLIFDASYNPVIETKVSLTDVSGTSFFFGFSDANTETSPASTIDYADGTLAAAATDAAGFVVDADKDSSGIYIATIATGGSVAGQTADPTKSLTTVANGTGTVTGLPLYLHKGGSTTLTATAAGTITVTLGSGLTGTVTSGTATITSSPVTLTAGANTVTYEGTGTATLYISGLLWTDAAEHVLRVKLTSDLDAEFYIDGVLTNIVQSAVTDVALCAVFNYGTRANDGANTVVVDYLKAWQDRG